MLESFIGTFDEYGLRTFESEAEKLPSTFIEDRQKFWVVIDRSVLSTIKLAMASGDSRSALKIIVLQARDIGRI